MVSTKLTKLNKNKTTLKIKNMIKIKTITTCTEQRFIFLSNWFLDYFEIETNGVLSKKEIYNDSRKHCDTRWDHIK